MNIVTGYVRIVMVILGEFIKKDFQENCKGMSYEIRDFI